MLRHRLLTAAVAIPIELAVIYLGSWPLTAFVALIAVLGLREFYQLAVGRQPQDLPAPFHVPDWIRWPGYFVAALVPVVARVRAGAPLAGLFVAAALLIALLAARVRRSPATQGNVGFAAISVGLVGSWVLPCLFSHLICLRYLQPHVFFTLAGVSVSQGAGWLALVVAVCWTTDSAALAVGKMVGRHKLWPRVSPGKTIEGSVGGLLASVLLTLWLGRWLGLSTGHALALGCALGVVGQLGDLAESKLKRWAGVKDSGLILPGHGGVLDHFDSLLANGPLAYYYLRLFAGA